jgi:glycosyltransferase involved in cell wall biosynthesis
VTEGENGWLFGDGNADELAEKILFAVERREMLPMIGLSARGVAESRADWSRNAAVLMQTYETVAGMKRK